MTLLKNKYLWIGIVVGLVLGDMAGVMFFKAAPSRQVETSPAGVATSSAFSLVVDSQPAGDAVLVASANVATTTWLAVRENNGSLLGRILGAHRVPPGETKGVTIELLRPTISHLMYAVVMYEDNGDGAFDNKLDTIVEEAEGQPLLYPFNAN